MSSDESDVEKKIKTLKINEKADINILLLGETGVGKSTFINSVANYITYTDLKKAEEENLLSLIPSKCHVTDKHGKRHIIQIGSEKDHNEYLDTGVSATQDVKTYVFPMLGEKGKVRLIDTPGMGDTRGIKQDDINCENILSYIGQLHELHAICFLFKPTNARITTFFKYCMAQILSRLDKSASKNIIFVFTNTRGADYSPGDTIRILEEVVKDIKSGPSSVDIPLNRNIFCFDNEALKYLAAIKQGVDFDNSIKLRNRESWQKSANECWRLVKYIVGDRDNPPLKPHFIKSTTAINEARRIITQLSQPLAEIAQLINDNLFVLERHKEHLNLDKNSLVELKKKLYMPVVNLDVTTLTHPVTVCGNSKCADIYKVGGVNKWHYKQRCHDPCYLNNVPKEVIGAPELIYCAAMNGTKTCKPCGCDFSVHLHVYYMTKTKEDRIVDSNIQKNINNKERVLENAKKLIEDIFERKMELEREHEVIVKSCARFAHFLQNNAITPFNDSYKDYINYLIIREKSLGVLCNKAVMHHLETLLEEYEEAKKSFDKALKIQKKLDGKDFVTPKTIQETIQKLYKLKHNGKKIKELYECQKKSRSKEHAYTEYVHKAVSKQKDKKKYKKESNAQKKPDCKEKQFNKGNAKHDSRSRNDRSKSQQRGRPRTPPPSYHDASHPKPSPGPYNPPPHSYAAYSPPVQGRTYPPTQDPAPYRPYPGSYSSAQGHASYDPYSYPPRHDDRASNDQKMEGGTTLEFKVVVDPKADQHTARRYPQKEAYPPRDPYPQREGYPSRDPYAKEPFPPYPSREPYPPYGIDYYRHPYPHSPYGAHPSGGYPHQYSTAPHGHYNQGTSGQSSGATHDKGAYQRRPQRYDNDNNRGRRVYRVETNKSQKFKQGYRKKNNYGKNNDSDEDSDTSVASSKK